MSCDCHTEPTTGELVWMFINLRYIGYRQHTSATPLEAMHYAVIDHLGSCLCELPGRFHVVPAPHSCTLCRATLMPYDYEPVRQRRG